MPEGYFFNRWRKYDAVKMMNKRTHKECEKKDMERIETYLIIRSDLDL